MVYHPLIFRESVLYLLCRRYDIETCLLTPLLFFLELCELEAGPTFLCSWITEAKHLPNPGREEGWELLEEAQEVAVGPTRSPRRFQGSLVAEMDTTNVGTLYLIIFR